MPRYPELELMYHCPNGGRRNKLEAARLKREGVKKGVPDIFLPVAKNGKHGLYIEMKSKQGKLEESQKAFIQKLKDQGYKVCVCYGWEQAKETLIEYLGA